MVQDNFQFDSANSGESPPSNDEVDFDFDGGTIPKLYTLSTSWAISDADLILLRTSWAVAGSGIELYTSWIFIDENALYTAWRLSPALSLETSWALQGSEELETSWQVIGGLEQKTSWKIINDIVRIPGVATHTINGIFEESEITFGGEQILAVSLKADLDSISWLATITIGDFELYNNFQVGTFFNIKIDSVNWRLCVTARKSGCKIPTKTWEITAVSHFSIVKDTKCSYVVEHETELVTDILSDILENVEIDWKSLNYVLKEDTVVAENATYFTILHELVEAVGCSIVCTPMGKLIVDQFYETKHHHGPYGTLQSKDVFSATTTILKNEYYTRVFSGSEELYIPRTMQITTVGANVEMREKILGIIVAPDPIPPTVTGNSYSSHISCTLRNTSAPFNPAWGEQQGSPQDYGDFAEKTETVVIRNGYGTTSTPLYSIISYSYGEQLDLGRVRLASTIDGTDGVGIVTEDIGDTIIIVTYSTQQYIFSVVCNSPEETSALLCFSVPPIAVNFLVECVARVSGTPNTIQTAPDILTSPFAQESIVGEERGFNYLRMHQGDLIKRSLDVKWDGAQLPDIGSPIRLGEDEVASILVGISMSYQNSMIKCHMEFEGVVSHTDNWEGLCICET